MTFVTTDTVRELSGLQAEVAVSIFVPTHRSGPETEQDRIRLKNLLTQVSDSLRDRGLRRPIVDALLEPAHDHLQRRDFWQHQGEGLAIYLSRDHADEFRLSVPTPELATIGHRFHILPLLSAISRERFLVLALSRADVRLFELTEDGIAPRELDAPKSLAEATAYADREAQLQHHAVGGGSAAFHGHDPSEQEAEDLRRFLNGVSKAVDEVSRPLKAPVVLACVDELVAAYRALATHLLASGHINGNPDDLGPNDLFRRSKEVVRTEIEQGRQDAAGRLETAIGQDRAVIGAEAALGAAMTGRVAELMWDQTLVTVQSGQLLDLNESPDGEYGLVDMLERAAIETINHGGVTWSLSTGQLTEPVAAILRY